MPRVYCVVYGCLNTASSTAELSFFKLPGDSERRAKWLRLICREDLMHRPSRSYVVCETHFNSKDILAGTHRKNLKSNSLPCLHLPKLQENEVETVPEAPKLVEIYTQTEENMTQLLASDSSQDSTSPSLDTSQKRKLEYKLAEFRKKIKTYEIDSKSGKYQRDTFHNLCDRFLTKQLAELVKAQTHLKFDVTGNRCGQNYKMFCLNLYYSSPQAYQLLQNAICLPSPKTLNMCGISVTSEINDRLMSILRTRIDAMNYSERTCSVVIGSMNLKANLCYILKQDKIIGFHEVNGVQTPEPAVDALVVMVRGIFVNWKQPVGFALLSDCRNNDEIDNWIENLLKKLFEIGLNIRALVSNVGSEVFNAVKEESVTLERPYFFVNNRKIFYIFDAPHLIKLVRNDLMSYDFHFQNHVVKYEHIVQFYENDQQKSFKLARKLTNSHIHPTNFERNKVEYATQLFSNSVAAGISTYVDFNLIHESGRGTAELIKMMNNLFDSLNSTNLKDNYEYRRGFCGKESQINFFKEMLVFFQNLKLVDPKNGNDVTSTAKFIYGFQITITSILLLFEDLKSEGCTFLPTGRLNVDALEHFFQQIRSKSGVAEPTSGQFKSAFQKIFFSNILKLPKACNWEDDLGKLLIQTSALCQLNDEPTFCEEKEVPSTEDVVKNVQIKSSEYNQLDIAETNSLVYVCGYLLKKCGERHDDCETMKSYIEPNPEFKSESQYTRIDEYIKDINQSLPVPVAPPDDFVQYVEKMDEIFCSCFQTEHVNEKITAFIYNEIDKIDFFLPCPCFPMVYLKALFIRLRIYYTIKFNNIAFRTCDGKRRSFTVNHL